MRSGVCCFSFPPLLIAIANQYKVKQFSKATTHVKVIDLDVMFGGGSGLFIEFVHHENNQHKYN